MYGNITRHTLLCLVPQTQPSPIHDTVGIARWTVPSISCRSSHLPNTQQVAHSVDPHYTMKGRGGEGSRHSRQAGGFPMRNIIIFIPLDPSIVPTPPTFPCDMGMDRILKVLSLPPSRPPPPHLVHELPALLDHLLVDGAGLVRAEVVVVGLEGVLHEADQPAGALLQRGRHGRKRRRGGGALGTAALRRGPSVRPSALPPAGRSGRAAPFPGSPIDCGGGTGGGNRRRRKVAPRASGTRPTEEERGGKERSARARARDGPAAAAPIYPPSALIGWAAGEG